MEKLRGLKTLEYSKRKSCFSTYLQLIFLPTIVFGYFILGYLGIASLPVHQHSIVLMGVIFFTSLLFARHNATLAKCVFRQNIPVFDKRLKEYITKNLVSMGDKEKSNSSFESFLEEETAQIRNSNYSSVGASVFPAMGILGTFISIAISMPDFSSSTTSELEREISILLSGVGTAFYVSIYGILLSLWWIFYEKMGLSAFEQDILKIKNNIKPYFWTKEELEQEVLKENVKHFKEIGSVVSALTNEEFLSRLSDSLDSKFKLFDKMLKLEEDTIELGSKHIKDTIKSAKEEQAQMGRVYKDMLGSIKRLNDGVEDMEEKFLDNYNSIRKGQASLNSTLQALNLTLEDNVSRLIPVYENFSQDLKKTQDDILEDFSKKIVSNNQMARKR